MASASRPRQRAVKLTAKAREKLTEALDQRWRLTHSATKLTRQARADMLGLSLPTVDRILGGTGVDRSSLIHAFKALDIPWNDQFCESSDEEIPTAPEEEPDLAVPEVRRPTSRRRWMGIGIAGMALFAAIAATRPRTDWTAEYDRELAVATQNYSRGAYSTSEQHLARAMEIAESRKTSRDLDAALKLRGDIAAARGRLSEAAEFYKANIRYRELRNRPTWAPIHQVLGSLQIRLRDFDAARKNLDIAWDAFTKNNEPNGIVEVMRDRGCLAAATQRPDEALEWFAKALQLLTKLNEPDLVMDIRGERAMVLLVFGRIAEAGEELEQCLAHWSKGGHARWIGLCEMRLGVVESKLGQTKVARNRFARARIHFVSVGDEARIAEVDAHQKSLPALR